MQVTASSTGALEKVETLFAFVVLTPSIVLWLVYQKT